jgi:putative ABC transport system permease protein
MSANSVSKPLPKRILPALFHPWTWRMAWRDSRSQRARLIIFASAIVAGIASLVAIHSLRGSMQTGIETQAKSLLGSDLMLSSRQPISENDATTVSSLATQSSREISFSSMLYFPTADAARLVQVRGVEAGYPFYGKVETTPPGAWNRLQSESGILLEAALLDQFGAKVGDRVKLGSLELPILGVIDQPAPRTGRFGAFSPEACIRFADLDRTGLLETASLSSHYLHLKLPPQTNAELLKKSFRERFSEKPWRFETPEDRRENLGDALDNLQQFLGIIALASLVLGAIGVAGAVHSHVSRRLSTVAILRCLGASGPLAFAVYLVQVIALGICGAALGALIGIAMQTGLLALFRDRFPFEIAIAPEWWIVAQTTAAGLAVCCGFALLPLLKIRDISPAMTLRGGATLGGISKSFRAWIVYSLLTGLLVLLALLNDSDWKRSLVLVGGLIFAFGLLLGVARALVFTTRKIVKPSWPYLLRQGISNLHRPQNQTLLFLLSLGLGTFLLVTILLSGNLLNQRLSLGQFSESPNIYLIDVQPDQLDGVTRLLKEQNLPALESAPMITMRIESVRGIPVREYEKQNGVPRWIARREFRSTYRDFLNPTETLVAGEWKMPKATPGEPVSLSLEEEIANDLDIRIGDEITLDVQGISLPAKVSSIRKVDWSRFNLNFFMVFAPGVLEYAPGFHVVTSRLPEGTSSGDLQRELVKQFPNVSAIDLTLILETVREILEQISAVVSVLAGFTVLAGIPILIGTLLNGRDLRTRESVLLRTLGASSKQVRTILLIEYATLGCLSALTGLILASAANAGLAIFVFKASPWPDPVLLTAAFIITTGLSILGGLLLSRGVSNHPPLSILRSGV